MKTTQQGIFTSLRLSSSRAALLVLAAALVLGSNAGLRAQTSQLQLVPSSAIPQSGTFYLIQLTNYPPLPFNPYPELNVYSLTEAPGRYWVDDRLVDWGAVGQTMPMDSALHTLQRRPSLDSDDGPPALPDGWDDWGGDDSPPPMSPSIAYPDGSLWLSIAQSSNGLAPLTIYGTVPEGLYEIRSELAVTNSAWTSEGAVLGAANQNWTPAMVAVGDRTNELFFQAIWWPNCDGYGTPAAWYVQHGLYPLAPGIGGQDANQDGLVNWQEYLGGTDPLGQQGFTVWVSSPGGYSGIP
jgi:hypothetical protein